ncbi:osteopetrosis-associated transmembrane protein 1 [Drosophila grimshawi]|uniref:osteopetrosis-associated transmembrane protein 1 n=1 Tax=Drosophila grimshawi TaxID=7222 RepID=UPI000C86F842|nr:osteopetrosis-associated transmembrane protein 1 [Drosophila grimshawi]
MRNFILLIILSCVVYATCSGECNTLLSDLADKQSKFVFCNTQHAIPIPPQYEHLCGGCKDNFIEMLTDYDNLMKVENCSKMYLDSDSISIVFTTQNVLKALWERAYCDECFKDNNYNNFTNLNISLSSCLNANKGSECSSCVYEYIQLNDFYKDLDQKNNGHMCFDMQDMMNRTRVLWSRDLKCCQREVKMTLFLVSVALFAGLPVLLFYGAAIVLTKRREANHGLLNEQQPELDDAPPSSTADLLAAALLATRPAETPAAKRAIEKMQRHALDSSCDDDESMAKPKIN